MALFVAASGMHGELDHFAISRGKEGLLSGYEAKSSLQHRQRGDDQTPAT
jgi:hypothetical protein